MQREEGKSIGILSVATDFPETRMSIEEIARKHNYDVKFLSRSLQLKEKRVAQRDDEHPSDMARRACQKALSAAQVSPEDVGLLVFTGLSRDFLPAWSVALSIIHGLGLSNAMGYDLAMGCVGPLIALQSARRRGDDGRPPYSLVVSAERWTHTLSTDKDTPLAVLGHGDGAAACVVGPDATHRLSDQAHFKMYPEHNDTLVIPAGGTKHPPSHETVKQNMHVRRSRKWNFGGITDRYVESYQEVIHGAIKTFSNDITLPQLLLTNQVPPIIRQRLHHKIGTSDQQTVNTFPYLGHVGGADTLICLEQAVLNNKVKAGYSVLASSTFSAFGAIALEGDSDGGIAVNPDSEVFDNAA